MLRTLVRFELRNLLREQMTRVMLIWPLLFAALLRVLIAQNVMAENLAGMFGALVSLMSGFAYGAMAAFSLLDDRDDLVFASIRISPLPLWLYVAFKVAFVYVLAVISGVIICLFSGAFVMSFGDSLLVAMLGALQVPFIALLANMLASNKVEGFVAVKGLGMMLLLPAAGYYFLDAKEWLFAIAPAHWAAKAVQRAMLQPLITLRLASMNLSFYQYLGIGFLYNAALVLVVFMLFMRKQRA